MTTNEIIALKKEYPEILSGEQIRCILHISKRKCAWLLNNGIIPCSNSGMKTRKYSVRMEDLITYISDSELHPENYLTPPSEFSAAKYNKKQDAKQNAKVGFPANLPEDFAEWLNLEWANLPDALTVPKVIAITGYCDNSIDRWLRNGHLKYAIAQTGKIIAKDWLIEFYCEYGYSIVKMSEKHIKLMRKFFGK